MGKKMIVIGSGLFENIFVNSCGGDNLRKYV